MDPIRDPFNILGQDFEVPPLFEDAVRAAVTQFEASVQRFESRCGEVPEEWFTDDEWAVIAHTLGELESAVERCEEGYVAVQYDSHAWYRIIESLQQITLRLDSAIGLMDAVANSNTTPDGV